MDNKGSWWMKGSKSDSNIIKAARDRHLSEGGGFTNPLTEFFEGDNDMSYLDDIDTDEEVDIPSILDEITRLSAKSPLVPYDRDAGDRSIEDIMREAERIYLESSKSFEQLSQRSKTSHNISEIASLSEKSDNSTPTPKSLSPLPLDDKPPVKVNSDDEDDSSDDDYTEKSTPQEKIVNLDFNLNTVQKNLDNMHPLTVNVCQIRESYIGENANASDDLKESNASNNDGTRSSCEFDCVIEVIDAQVHGTEQKRDELNNEVLSTFKEEIVKKDEVIQMLIVDNRGLKQEVKTLEVQIEEMKSLLEQATASMRAQNIKSPEINLELEKALEELKDTKEVNTSLQLQLDNTNKSHQMLRVSYDELANNNKQLERRMLDVDSILAKYRTELQNAQQQKEKIVQNEASIAKLLELEKTQVKNLKQQLEKDSKCIMDLNRQIKEMERIIARKHPDSVSALIVAAKSEAESYSTPTARKVLEERIKILEQEALMRDAQNSQVFIDVHDKFNQMKSKYENHIDDLELHVSDLKSQLKRRVDTYDVYTQTIREEAKMIPEKDTSNVSVQTDPQRQLSKTGVVRKPEREREVKEETHLLATIRGFQADLSNKEKVVAKLQKEIDELRKTNRRLQKEREGSLKNLSDKKEFRSYPEKLAQSSGSEGGLDDELRAVKTERDKMKFQLCRIEEDYQSLKEKRLHDLNALQEAHEREIATYLANVTPLREQLEVHQVSLSAIQQQLLSAKEQLAVVTVERDHLNNKLNSTIGTVNLPPEGINGNDGDEVVSLRKKISHLELKYEERENRLRAIVHGLAQKSVTNRSCEQCAARQQQLIGYKAELDQIIATLRCLQ